jgi:hypothetical protein
MELQEIHDLSKEFTGVIIIPNTLDSLEYKDMILQGLKDTLDEYPDNHDSYVVVDLTDEGLDMNFLDKHKIDQACIEFGITATACCTQVMKQKNKAL